MGRSHPAAPPTPDARGFAPRPQREDGEPRTRQHLPQWVRSHAVPAPEFAAEALAPGCDPLEEFLAWYGAHGPSWPMTPADGLRFHGVALPGVTLYRSGPFQVQLFVFAAGTRVPEHRHPNVDTIELHVAGDFDFRVQGRPAIPCDHLHDRRGPVSRWWGRGVRVRPSTWHDLRVGPGGTAFLSVQRWLNGVTPSTVGADWEGAPVNAEHAGMITT
jgi:hypothetical protein